MAAKEMILRAHLLPVFGKHKLEAIGYGEIQDYCSMGAVTPGWHRSWKRDQPSAASALN